MRDGSVELYYAHFYGFEGFSWRNCLFFSARKMTFFIPFFLDSEIVQTAVPLLLSSSSLSILPYSLLFVICTVPSIFETIWKYVLICCWVAEELQPFSTLWFWYQHQSKGQKNPTGKLKKKKRNQICTGSHVTVQPFYLAAVVAAAIYIH